MSLALLIAFPWMDRRKNRWLFALFASVFICELGYFLTSISRTLEGALTAYRVSYLGNVFLPFFMLMMLLDLNRLRYPKVLPKVLVVLSTLMLLLAASGGWSTLYYKEVSLEFADGAAQLVREYGPLHGLYGCYLYAYFAAMVGLVLYAAVKRRTCSVSHTIFLAVAALGNISIWMVEKLIPRSFEFLAISYVLTALMLLLLDNVALSGESQPAPVVLPTAEGIGEGPIHSFTPEQIDAIFAAWPMVSSLSEREREVLRLILANRKRRDIAQELFVTEHTIKKHTAGIFKKLSVSSRPELYEIARRYC